MRVAEAAIAALGKHEFLAKRGEIMDQRFAILIENLGTDRHLEHDRFAIGAMAVLAHAIGALLRLEVLLITIVDQRVQSIDDFDDDIAAAAAIAAGGAAELVVLLAAERPAAVTAVAGANIDLCLIQEFHGPTIAFSSEVGTGSRRNQVYADCGDLSSLENASKLRSSTSGSEPRL